MNAALEGRVPKPGGFGDNPKHGEQEVAVPGAIGPENISKVGIVEIDPRSGNQTIRWITKEKQ